MQTLKKNKKKNIYIYRAHSWVTIHLSKIGTLTRCQGGTRVLQKRPTDPSQAVHTASPVNVQAVHANVSPTKWTET